MGWRMFTYAMIVWAVSIGDRHQEMDGTNRQRQEPQSCLFHARMDMSNVLALIWS